METDAPSRDATVSMDRRAFLTLIASAPIAALAPLPSILQDRRALLGGYPDWWRDPNVKTHSCGGGD